MIESLLYWTGVVVWVLIVMYVFPIIPVVLLALLEVVLQRIGLWWADTYLPEREYSKERYDEYAQKREEEYWRSKLNKYEVIIRYKVKAVRKSLMKTIDRYWYRYLPTL